jgi:anti-sigma B factor antagonist
MPELSSETLKVKWDTRGTAVVVSPVGDVDLNASPTLRQALKQVQQTKPQSLVIDLSGVPYMDSSGVATLVEAMKIARDQRSKMTLAAPTARVKSIFEIARLDMVFKIVPSVEVALTS